MVVLICSSSAMHQPTLWAMVEEPAPPRAPTKATTRPIGRGVGVQIKAGDHFDQLQRRQRRHQIFRRAAAHQFAIEFHVVGRGPTTTTLVAGSQTSASRSSSSSAAWPCRRVSTIRRLGVDLAVIIIHRRRRCRPAARVRCALDKRRSAPARCSAAPVSGNSQKAWMEMRGTGRSCGAAPNVHRLAGTGCVLVHGQIHPLFPPPATSLIAPDLLVVLGAPSSRPCGICRAPSGGVAHRPASMRRGRHQIARIGDHGGEIVLAGAAEIGRDLVARRCSTDSPTSRRRPSVWA